MIGQNYYDTENLTAGLQLVAPLRCACPSANQTANEVTFLLVYRVTWGDTITSIGETFGVSVQKILDANMLSPNPLIYPFTFILVPLDTRNCLGNTGKFFCSCPNGFLANGSFGGLTCISDAKKIPVKLVSLIGVGIGVGFLCLFMSGYQLCQYLTRRRCRIHKQKMFRKNGGLLLKKKFSSLGRIQKATVFTEEALQRATDNYNSNRFLGQGGYGTVYKGMLPDGSIVAVKKSKEIDSSWIEQFINEVFILSQINHRNIVKLLGCCLETEVPLLVYEFVPNGTLSSHIHDQDLESSLSWQNRLRIACEVAGAVAYMHSAASVPIFHRDIKSSNILLDDKYSSRVSDFGTSRSVPLDQSHVTTAVQGTFGYFDPEYFRSSQFTEKSDVYSFGVVLVELLTGEKPITFAGDEELRNLGAHFISSIKEDRLLQILDPRVAKEGDRDEIIAVAALAKRCLRYNGITRPTMKEVAMELERLRESQTVLQVNRGSQIWSAESSAMDTVAEAEEERLEDGNVLEIDSASI